MCFVIFAMALTIGAQPKILLVGDVGKINDIMPSDSIVIEYLKAQGMEVTWVADDNVEVTYDYSPYDAVVFGESMSSSKVVAFGTTDSYPAPCVTMEPLSVRDDKWAWISNREEHFQENRKKLLGWDKLQITDETHFITNVFEKDQVITWSTADTTSWELFAYGLDLASYIPDAVPLATNMSSGTSFPCLWALEQGTSIPGGKTLDHRMVVNGTHSKGIAIDDDENAEYGKICITDDFLTIIHRSVRWVLGAEVGIGNYEIRSADVSIYPNPARDEAILKFAMDDPGIVSVRVINLVGKTVKICEREFRTPGSNEMRILVDDLPGGIYLYLLEAGTESFAGKFQVLR